LFSTKAIWIKLCFKESSIDATTLLMLRMLLSLPFYFIMLLYLKKRNTEPLKKSHYIWAIALGLLGYYLSSLFDFIGLHYVSAGIERIILFIYPTLAVLINFWIFKVAITKKQWLAISITYIGIAIAYWGEFTHLPNTSNFVFGSVMVLLCGITYAFYLVGTGKLVPLMGSSLYTSIAMLAASAGIFSHYLVRSIDSIGFMHAISYQIPTNIVWYIVGLALFATVIPSFLLSSGMKRIGSNDLAIITSIGPVSTLFQANYILNEPLLWQQALGTAFVIAGVVLVQKFGVNKTNPEHPNYPSPKG
jgi:drug/metabolite transporter (DMT)-like permease